MSDAIPSGISLFEAIRQTSAAGDACWSARDLMLVLEYTKWQRFREVVQRAVIACQQSGQESADHFTRSGKMVAIGSRANRRVEDFQLSRYACYLIIQNADPDKPIVALGQTYFAVQTRRQELADADLLTTLNENQKRLVLRSEVADHNTKLASAAQQSGVITDKDFAIFQDHGYRGLYGGLGARDIHARKGLKRSQQILDHMGSTELAANLFRATQTEEKLRRENVAGKEAANRTHAQVGQVVRETIRQLGGTMPEDLPTPPKSIQQIRNEELERLTHAPQLPLFDEEAPSDS